MAMKICFKVARPAKISEARWVTEYVSLVFQGTVSVSSTEDRAVAQW